MSENLFFLSIMSLPTIFIAAIGIVVFVFAIIIISFFSVWLRAWLSKAPVSITTLLAMRLRRVPYAQITDARITAIKAGLDISIDALESHYLAEGNVFATVQALIAADKANLSLTWQRAAAIDLATKGTNKSVIEAVKTSVNPKVIDCPSATGGRNYISGVSKDGIEVRARARVTVRTNLDRFIGGAQEETIVARVGEGIVTTIGSSESYKFVLEYPDKISKTVLARGLDTGTAFEILSIDIADVDIGDNIGAKLQEAQAEANKNMAQAQAEIRRAAAVALEQEMKAKVVEAQSQVPLAIAEAFKQGKLGVLDYYHMQNLQADTTMRESISGNPTKSS